MYVPIVIINKISKVFQYNVYFGLQFSIIYFQPVNIKVLFHIFTES